ncbi:MAG: IS110 family transposase [archaeon]|nr:IS110 family transposase [archaeon]
MKKTKETLQETNTTKEQLLHLSFELGDTRWKLASSNGKRVRTKGISARNLEQLQEEIERARQRFKLNDDVKIVSCYEAGRDGFWLHRYLLSCGIKNIVVDSSSIEVDRRKRRAKTDRIDAEKLLQMLMRYHGGERLLWRVVNVPSVEDEDGRQLHRELDVLKRERIRHRNRIKGILMQQGIALKNPSGNKFLEELDLIKTWDGEKLPSDLKARLVREYDRLQMVEDQIYSLKKERQRRLENADSAFLKKVVQLMNLRGIAVNSSWKFVNEFFGWRQFKNRRELGALAGLTPTPYDSGGSQHEQGISKAGNSRIRTLAVEMSWVWLRLQPQSKLSRWYMERFGSGGKRMRRIGIVAMARKLLIDLWQYLEYGVIPEGASLRTEMIRFY